MANVARLSRQEQRVLWEIRRCREAGVPASYRELAERFGISAAGAFGLVSRLEQKGFVSRSSGSPRGVQVLLCPSCTVVAEKAHPSEFPMYCVDCCQQVSS